MNSSVCSRTLIKMIAALLILVSASAQAQDSNETQELAIELLELMDAQQMLTESAEKIWPVLLEKALANRASPPEDAVRIVRKAYTDAWAEYVPLIMAHTASIWQKHFNATELRELIDLYKTPLGQKMIKIMPEVMAESAKVGQDLIPPLINRFNVILKERLGRIDQNKVH